MKNYGVDNLTAVHLEISLAFGRIFEKPLLSVSVVHTVAVWAEQLHGLYKLIFSDTSAKCEMNILCRFCFAQLQLQVSGMLLVIK